MIRDLCERRLRVGEVLKRHLISEKVFELLSRWRHSDCHLSKLSLEVGYICCTILYRWLEGCFHLFSPEQVPVYIDEKWVLFDLDHSHFAASYAQLWIIAEQFLDEIVSCWTKEALVLVLLDETTVVLDDHVHALRHLLWCRTLLLIILERIPSTEHLEQQDTEAEPVNRGGVVLVFHHFRSHVL